MNGLLADLSHALRIYRNTPVASVLAVIMLAVAMAFVAALLSLWNDLAFESHAGFEDSGELVTVGVAGQGGAIGGLMVPGVADLDAQGVTLEGVVGTALFQLFIERSGERMQSRAELVTAGYFETLRPRLAFGSGFSADDHRSDSEPVVVISHDLWRSQFDRRPDVIGESLEVVNTRTIAYPGGPVDADERVYEDSVHRFRIVGVMAPEMHATFERGPATELWMPYERAAPNFTSVGTIRGLRTVGRLAEDATLAQVQAELDARYPPDSAELRQVSFGPSFLANRLAAVEGVVSSPAMVRDGKRQVGLFLAGTVLLAVVAACNASLFLLSRAPTRRRELGIRASLGATSRRLARQLASEAALLVAAAAAVGVLASLWLAAVLRNLTVFADVQWRGVSPLGWRTLVMIAALTAVLGCVVALAPMLGLRREGIAAVARRTSARAGWGQRAAGTAQVCIAAVVSAVAVAFAWQLVAYATADRGFRMTDIAVLRISSATRGREQGWTNAEREAIMARRVESIRALPGVESVALASQVPGEEVQVRRATADALPNVELPPGELSLGQIEIDAGFVPLLGLELIHGRTFDASDSDPVLVNESMARSLWGRTDVVGEAFGRSSIVGVLRDVNLGHSAQPIPPMYFSRVRLVYDVLVRSAYTPAELRALLQQQIDSGALELEIDNVEPLASIWNAQFAADRARVRMTAGAAVLVVLLAAFGFYGTQRYLVAAGRREYAVRAAIGAGPAALGRLVLWRGVELGLPGLLLGILFACIAVAWLRGDFVTASVSVFGVVTVVALAMLALVLSASLGPSRQVRTTPPAPLLREE